MHVKVIVPDNFIAVDGVGYLGLTLPETKDIHAIEFDSDKTYVEKTNGDGYFDGEFKINPFVEVHTAETERLAAVKLAAEKEYDLPINSWKRGMAALDVYVNRQTEETMTAKTTDGYSDFMIEKYNEKIKLRDGKPE